MNYKTGRSAILRPDQLDEVARVRELRREAESLRSKVSRGFYGPDEAERFWAIAKNASFVLRIGNPEIAARAGLGPGFFSTVVREKRNPKLRNFLAALTVMIDISNERLVQADNNDIDWKKMEADDSLQDSPLARRRHEIYNLSVSLANLARTEIAEISSTPANHPETRAHQIKQIELLQIFAEGFEQIAKSLSRQSPNADGSISIKDSQNTVSKVGIELDKWWKENGHDAIDWAIRLPVFVGGVAALGWAGANMTIATTAIGALIGGAKVVDAINRKGTGKRKA
ncbi:hypothetical protein [Rhodopseudomonas sp. AAP120]|uniref:hypothetical protein n=1 Tax=Rhodopseudomonas sp. AAP120 TaxID=1523430 RepID=UPI000AD8C058|nr:hypothetical protein [Rhodopseudomonas sp. AAP120]